MSNFFLMKQSAKATKQSHAYKAYTTTYNAAVLNSFDPEVQPKNADFAIRNKLNYSFFLVKKIKRNINFICLYPLHSKNIMICYC